MDKIILAQIGRKLKHLKRKRPKSTYRERLRLYHSLETELKAFRDRIPSK